MSPRRAAAVRWLGPLATVHVWLACAQAPDRLLSSNIGSWLQGTTVELPYISLPGPIIDVQGGNCTGFEIGDIRTRSFGSSVVPGIEYHLTGVRAQCRILAHNGMLVRFGMSGTEIRYGVEIQPFRTSSPKLSLPMGPVTVTKCQASGQLEYLEFSGESALSPMLESMGKSLRSFIEEKGPGFACKMMKSYIGEQATQMLAVQANEFTRYFGAEAPASKPPALTALVDWSDYPIVQMGKYLLKERPSAVKALLGLASPMDVPQFVRPMVQTFTSDFGKIRAAMLVNFVHIEGLESLIDGSLSLDGVGTNIMATARFGHVAVTIGMTMTIDLLSGPVRAPRPLEEKLNFTLDMRDLVLGVDILAMVSKTALDALFVDQYQQPRCIAGCAKQATNPWSDSLGVWSLASDMTPAMRIRFRPGTLEEQLASSIDTTVASALDGFMPAIQALVDGAVQVRRAELTEAMWKSIESLPPCGPTNVYLGPGAFLTNLLFWGGMLVLAFGLAVTALGILAPEKGHDVTLRIAEIFRLSSPRDISAPANVDPEGTALSEHPVVPPWALILYPCVAVSAMILFLYADVCLATSINFVFHAKGQTLTVGPALAFSVVIIAIDSFQAKAYLIAFCIAGMSIVWPFVKLIALLAAWQAPEFMMSWRLRGRLLVFLDEYGKWSLMDTWLGILALACYKLAWHSAESDAFFMVDPVPNMPFFMFVFASVLTLALGHVAGGIHRRALEWDRGQDGHATADKDCMVPRFLCRHFDGHRALLIFCGTTATMALLIMGAQVTSFQMVESGALATLLLDDDKKAMQYSLRSLGETMTKGKDGDIGLHMVQFIFFTFSVAIPVCLQTSLLALCFLPLRYEQQLFLFDLCRALDAWAAFDVFAMAVTISHFEFGLFSRFLMHYNNLAQGCNLVGEYLHEECFHMECSLTPGFAVLALAAILCYVLPKVVFPVCRVALDERGGVAHGSLDQWSEDDEETDYCHGEMSSLSLQAGPQSIRDFAWRLGGS